MSTRAYGFVDLSKRCEPRWCPPASVVEGAWSDGARLASFLVHQLIPNVPLCPMDRQRPLTAGPSGPGLG